MRLAPRLWHRRARAVRERIFGDAPEARLIRDLLYEYADLRRQRRIPLLGTGWMPKGNRTSEEALILEGRRQVVAFLESVAGLSPEQLDALDGPATSRDFDDS